MKTIYKNEWRRNLRRWYRDSWIGRIDIYISNRRYFSHTAKTNLNKGQWYDTDTRLFESVFGLLVQFVETELANNMFFDDESSIVKEYKSQSKFSRWKNRHIWNERLGLAHLEWAMTLTEDSPYQAECAKKIKELYLWYKYERVKRPDPWDESDKPLITFIDKNGNFTETFFRNEQDSDGFYRSNEATEEYMDWIKKCSVLEQQQYEENTKKAQEVLEIRQGLWT